MPFLIYYQSLIVKDPDYHPFMTVYCDTEEEAIHAFRESLPYNPMIRVEKQEVMN